VKDFYYALAFVIKLALESILREIGRVVETLEKISCLKEDTVGH
jgi:hypothetical protein